MGRFSRARRAAPKRAAPRAVAKPRAGQSLKRPITSAKPRAGQSLKTKTFRAGKELARGIPFIGGGISAVEAFRGTGAQAAVVTPSGVVMFGKRKKGKIPKGVRRWLSRTLSRRKAEEKAVRKLLKISNFGKVSRRGVGSSKGVITRQEALAALAR